MREYNVESPNQDCKRFNSQVRRNTLPIWVYYLSMPGVLGTETHTNKYLVCRVHTPGHLHKKICLSIFFSRGWLFLSARRRVLPQSLSFSFFVRLEPHTSLAVPLSGCEHLFYNNKGAVSRDFLPCLPFFISWIEAIWGPDKQDKMVLLENSFLRRYSQKFRLRVVLACAESNSALAYIAQSRTRRRLTLCGVGNWNVRKSKIG